MVTGIKKMKSIFLLLLCFISCNDSPKKVKINSFDEQKDPVRKEKIKLQPTIDSINKADIDDNYENYFLVIVQTNDDYSTLRKSMFSIHQTLKIPIDTLRRSFDQETGEIVYLDSADLEIYGEKQYFPRRGENYFLSIEQLYFYDQSIDFKNKRMMLLAGIYNEKKAAVAKLDSLKSFAPAAYIFKSKIYMGCMH